jgi:hypothetical protein
MVNIWKRRDRHILQRMPRRERSQVRQLLARPITVKLAPGAPYPDWIYDLGWIGPLRRPIIVKRCADV